MELTGNQKRLVKAAQKDHKEAIIKSWGGRIKIKVHGGKDSETGLKNCGCCI